VDLFGGTIRNLERSIDMSAAKNRAISSNIANVDTPNYKSKDVVFKDVLDDAMTSSTTTKRTDPRHIPFNNLESSSHRVITKNNTTYNHNGNNVDIDKEMTELATNQIYYNSLIDRINGKFGSIQTVIRGGN